MLTNFQEWWEEYRVTHTSGQDDMTTARDAYEKGEKVGMREVVEFIRETRETPLGTDSYGYYVWEAALEAKLKEWGL